MLDENNNEQHTDNNNEQGEHDMDGWVISKKSLWLTAAGAFGALGAIALAKLSNKMRPAVVGTVKEGYAFKEWMASKAAKTKEDVEDIIEEAKYAYTKDLESASDTVRREKEILEKIEKKVEAQIAKNKEEN